MGINSSGSDIIEMRRERVAYWRLRRFTQRAIAAKLAEEGIVNKEGNPFNVATINLDLKALDKKWQERALEAVDAHKARELSLLDEVEREAWAAWQASQMPRLVVLTEETRENDDGQTNEEREANGQRMIVLRSKERKTVEESTGDPRYLDIIKDCVAKRAKLLGLDAPDKRQISGSVEVDITDRRQAEQELEEWRKQQIASLSSGPNP